MDVWDISFERFPIARKGGCPSCSGRYDFLEDRVRLIKSSLCGQSRAIQIVDTDSKGVALDQLASRLSGVKNLTFNEYMLRFDVDDVSIIVFPDGRAIIRNTLDELVAEKLYFKYVGKENGQ